MDRLRAGTNGITIYLIGKRKMCINLTSDYRMI